jgi:beta-phosphoglucomutase-like phosphatase (HAD superfamily)
VAQLLLDRFGLASAAAALESTFNVSTPRDAFIALRLQIYGTMLADPALIRRQELPYATALVRHVRRDGYRTALTTVSHAAQAFVVLDALGLRDQFDVIVTIDDVEHGKPDPEIYLLACRRLALPPSSCLAIEDSLPGVRAAIAAHIACVASTNDLTRASIHAATFPSQVTVIDDPAQLEPAVRALLTKPEGTPVWS